MLQLHALFGLPPIYLACTVQAIASATLLSDSNYMGEQIDQRSSGMERNYRYDRKNNVKENTEYNEKFCSCSLGGSCRDGHRQKTISNRSY